MFLYVIHFAEPLHHAQHYTGSCVNLKRRLAQHANDEGAKIIAAINAKGIAWELSALYQCNDPRKAERIAKRHKHGPELCFQCREKPKAIPGTIAYDITDLIHTYNSKSLRGEAHDV